MFNYTTANEVMQDLAIEIDTIKSLSKSAYSCERLHDFIQYVNLYLNMQVGITSTWDNFYYWESESARPVDLCHSGPVSHELGLSKVIFVRFNENEAAYLEEWLCLQAAQVHQVRDGAWTGYRNPDLWYLADGYCKKFFPELQVDFDAFRDYLFELWSSHPYSSDY